MWLEYISGMFAGACITLSICAICTFLASRRGWLEIIVPCRPKDDLVYQITETNDRLDHMTDDVSALAQKVGKIEATLAPYIDKNNKKP